MADNTLLVADGYIGLLRVSLSDGAITTLLSYGQVLTLFLMFFVDHFHFLAVNVVHDTVAIGVQSYPGYPYLGYPKPRLSECSSERGVGVKKWYSH